MLSTPFVAFYIVGQIFQANTLALIKMFLLTCLYAVVHTMGNLLFYGELKNVFPLSIYMATKLWFYITWFIFFMPVVDFLTTLGFLFCSGVLWYCFLNAWKGDPGVIVATEEDRIKVYNYISTLYSNLIRNFNFFYFSFNSFFKSKLLN